MPSRHMFAFSGGYAGGSAGAPCPTFDLFPARGVHAREPMNGSESHLNCSPRTVSLVLRRSCEATVSGSACLC